MRIHTVLRRGLAARRARAAATGLAVAAAVAFLSGTYVLTDTINASVQQSAAQAVSGVSAIVTAAGGLGGSLLAGAPELPPALVSRVRHVPGVVAADGITAGYAMPLDRSGHGVSSVAGIGISVPADPRLRLLSLRSGRWPRSPGEIVIDASTAARLGLRPGATLRVALAGGTAPVFTVTGIAGFGSAGNVPGLSVVGFDSAAAPALLSSGGRYSAIEAAGAVGLPAPVIARQIKAALGHGYTVRTAAQQASQLTSTVAGLTSAIGTVLQVFAIIALVVAALLIASIFTITVAQRSRELALLRCVGASRGQVARLVLSEAALIGAAGGVAGLFGGIALAAGLRAGLGALGLPLPAQATVVRAHTIVASLTVGFGVTIAAAAVAAAQAARSRPLAALAMPQTTSPARAAGHARGIAAALCMIGGAGLLAVAPIRLVAAAGALMLITGAGAGAPMLVRPLTAPARGALRVLAGTCGQLSSREILRNPRRVAGSASILAIAIAAITIVAAVAATFTASATLDVNHSLRADWVITTPPQAGLDPALTRKIAALPGVALAEGIPCGTFRAPSFTETLCGIDPATYPRLVNLGITAGRLASLTPGTIAVSARAAARTHWQLGQTISLHYPLGGTRPVRIVALYSYDLVAGAYLIPLTDYTHGFLPAQQADQTILAAARPGALHQVQQEITGLLASYPQATLNDKTGYARQLNSGINTLATLMTGLLALSLIIGLLAVAAALALTVLERTRETGLLRAVGAEARQIRAIIRGEALATVTAGTLTGIALGLAIGWPLARTGKGALPGPPGIPVTLLAAVIPAAILAGLIAAAVPARRAARLDILTALRAE